ncbi:MAG: efflux RND transporter permease subunit [Xanthomonadales bacterium]|nr:efflux RND transporter permease subunit [Gammaproteobacteria bacterium]MBT8053114.1 efflux RND transporter permease subunit [Gammaproteobacteria bacterium]NND56234.1 efflux RND transporter permease subunit [Xanthomonadales bacterium]NNK52309.1 efflux RND transporter permease subunit [Xanthomonadales bacterium]
MNTNQQGSNQKLGVSGSLAARFLRTEITPLLALMGLLLGLFAVAVTPREEEPQIDVTFANVFIAYPGASASEVEQLVSTPMERILSEIDGVEHIYSVSRPGNSILTVQFEVGEPRDEAIVRLYNAVYSNQDWMPPNIGVLPALIKPRGIDDVPIVTGTLWSDDPQVGAHELRRVAHVIETELQRVPGTRDIDTIGGPDRVVSVRLDPERLSGFDVDLQQLRDALASANASADAGSYASGNQDILVQAGTFLSTPDEVAELVVGVKEGGRPVYLRDVAEVTLGPDLPESRVNFGLGPANSLGLPAGIQHPAVTMAVAKKPGINAVEVADAVIARFEHLRGSVLPHGMHATITRNYGATADDKAKTLIKKLVFATLSVIILVGLALGRREAMVVGAAVIITLAITLFASWAWGFTLNRVSLFALIFSIGILVDDAIVVVENAHRHMHISRLPLFQSIPIAVEEVGGPTILATFTVIAALLPMAFVSGLMGPYMAPIPINASMGMLISLFVAFVFTPWLFYRAFASQDHSSAQDESHSDEQSDRLYQFLYRSFDRYLRPFLSGRAGRKRRLAMLGVVLALITASVGLVAVQWVVLKMLPFDNKSEFQVVVDMPEGTPVEQTQRVLDALSLELTSVPEVMNYQTYAGTSAPINFNGLVRQYYLRAEPHQGDIQVNLVDRTERSRQSHEIALAVRQPLQAIGEPFGANVKVVEVPPGPPVIAPLVAEVYGSTAEQREATARAVRAVFENTPDIVDVDDTLEAAQERLLVSVDRQRAARLGVSQSSIVAAIATAIRGEDASYLHDDSSRRPVPIRLELGEGMKADPNAIANLRVRGSSGRLVPLSEVAHFTQTTREQAIYHKNLLPMVLVTGDLSGKLDSPLYGMAEIAGDLPDAESPEGGINQYLIRQPADPYVPSLKWDGEWQVTYETFRDMGLAYAVGLILIYLLVVAQFRSYRIPLIIMAPIPLTLIGILPGHALLDRQFTATSMIGMIALAGIIVRNSILLVDFIHEELGRGVPLADAVVKAGAVRTRPIALTALAAMAGAFFILDDPIFSGLAVSLIFGILVSTILTLVVIPVVYYAYEYRAKEG